MKNLSLTLSAINVFLPIAAFALYIYTRRYDAAVWCFIAAAHAGALCSIEIKLHRKS